MQSISKTTARMHSKQTSKVVVVSPAGAQEGLPGAAAAFASGGRALSDAGSA